MIQRRLGWAFLARGTGPNSELIEGGGCTLDLSAGFAHLLEDGDELVAGYTVVTRPGIIPSVRGGLASKRDLEPILLELHHVPDEATEGCSATDRRERQTVGIDSLDFVDKGATLEIEPTTKGLALVEGLHRDRPRALVHWLVRLSTDAERKALLIRARPERWIVPVADLNGAARAMDQGE